MVNNISILLVCIFIIGCTHKSFIPQNVIPELPSFDSSEVSYKSSIKPILTNNCYVCHATAVTLNGGLDLEDFTSLKNYLFLDFRGDGIYGSKFYHCLLHSSLALAMPPTYKLDSISLKKIRIWINNGGKYN